MDEMRFGELLRGARKRAFDTIPAFANALSQRGLADTDDAITHWEHNRRNPYTHNLSCTC